MGYCNDMARSCLCADCKNTECEERCRLDCAYENFEKVTECEDYNCGADMRGEQE